MEQGWNLFIETFFSGTMNEKEVEEERSINSVIEGVGADALCIFRWPTKPAYWVTDAESPSVNTPAFNVCLLHIAQLHEQFHSFSDC